MTIYDATKTGDRRTALVALRDQLAVDLDECASMRDKAALAQRFLDVLEQIADIDRAAPAVKGTVLDEVDAKRSSKQAAADKARAAGRRL